MKTHGLLEISAILASFPLVISVIDESTFHSSKIITKDVAILGGGASGAHAAVRLREDLGKSIIVIEKQNRLVCWPP